MFHQALAKLAPEMRDRISSHLLDRGRAITDVADFYWIVGGDESQVYSSARNAMVPIDDPEYGRWLKRRGYRPTRIHSFGELRDVLAAYGIALADSLLSSEGSSAC